MKTRIENRRNRRSERGGAMVEMVVLMLIFVPLVLIPMYFQDAMRFKLDAQEAVFSTVWDFAYGKYDEKSIDDYIGTIQTKNGEIFGNGWSGNTNGKPAHAGPWANFEWTNGASQPVICKTEDADYQAFSLLLPGDFHREFNKGGLVQCEGTIDVENHYVPQVFLSNMTGGNNKDHFIEKNNLVTFTDNGDPYTFGVMVDPWCIHDAANIIDSEGNDPFIDRVKYVWRQAPSTIITYEIFEIAWAAFLMKATSADILSPVGPLLFEWPPGKGLDRVPRVTSKHLPNDTMNRSTAFGRDDFYVSPHEDGDDDMYKKTFEERDVWYLGCEGSLQDNC